MDLVALRHEILRSNTSAGEKAETFLRKSQVNGLSKDEWRQLIAGIPEDVEKGIGVLMSVGRNSTEDEAGPSKKPRTGIKLRMCHDAAHSLLSRL
ncbi:TPA: hypothetical protein ACH3X1_007791 [Trebouxia sp. C0004]